MNKLTRGILNRFSDPVANKILELATKWGAEDFVLSTTIKEEIHISELAECTVIKLSGRKLIAEEFWVEGDTIPLETGMAILCMEPLENERGEIINTLVVTFVSVMREG